MYKIIKQKKYSLVLQEWTEADVKITIKRGIKGSSGNKYLVGIDDHNSGSYKYHPTIEDAVEQYLYLTGREAPVEEESPEERDPSLSAQERNPSFRKW